MRALVILGSAAVAATILSGCIGDRRGLGYDDQLSVGGFSSSVTNGGVGASGSVSASGSGGAAGTPTTVMFVTANNNDSWNNQAHWDNGVPAGTINAEISAGLEAQVFNSAPAYAGNLTLHDGASLVIHRNDGFTPQNAVENPSVITMGQDSALQLHTQDANTLQSILLAGTGTEIRGQDDWHITTIEGTISGAYALTFLGWGEHDFQLKANNSFSGGMICNAMDRYIVTANSAGAFGTGDITVNRRLQDERSAVLVINADDAMADTATLYLNGAGWNGSNGGSYVGTYTRLQMNADDTIADLYLDGVQLASGSYTGTADPNDWIGGAGTLTVGP